MTWKQEKEEHDRVTYGVLGDINPTIVGHSFYGHRSDLHDFDDLDENDPMEGGSRHGNSHHAGSREMTEGVTGGTGTEVGGTRNYRQGTGFTGGDIGNRPE
jgi:hypothetical protein